MRYTRLVKVVLLAALFLALLGAALRAGQGAATPVARGRCAGVVMAQHGNFMLPDSTVPALILIEGAPLAWVGADALVVPVEPQALLCSAKRDSALQAPVVLHLAFPRPVGR